VDGRQRQPPGRRQAASASERLYHRPPRDIPLCWRQSPSNRQQSPSASIATNRAKGVPAASGNFFVHADLYRTDGYLSLLRTDTTAARPMTGRRDRRPGPMAAEICLPVHQPDILVSARSTPPDERQGDDLLMRKGDLREPPINRSQRVQARACRRVRDAERNRMEKQPLVMLSDSARTSRPSGLASRSPNQAWNRPRGKARWRRDHCAW
jgi:hypothetical protein